MEPTRPTAPPTSIRKSTNNPRPMTARKKSDQASSLPTTRVPAPPMAYGFHGEGNIPSLIQHNSNSESNADMELAVDNRYDLELDDIVFNDLAAVTKNDGDAGNDDGMEESGDGGNEDPLNASSADAHEDDQVENDAGQVIVDINNRKPIEARSNASKSIVDSTESRGTEGTNLLTITLKTVEDPLCFEPLIIYPETHTSRPTTATLRLGKLSHRTLRNVTIQSLSTHDKSGFSRQASPPLHSQRPTRPATAVPIRTTSGTITRHELRPKTASARTGRRGSQRSGDMNPLEITLEEAPPQPNQQIGENADFEDTTPRGLRPWTAPSKPRPMGSALPYRVASARLLRKISKTDKPVVTQENCKAKVFPRKQRRLDSMQQLEKEIEEETNLDSTGLTKEQSRVVFKAVAHGEARRQAHRLAHRVDRCWPPDSTNIHLRHESLRSAGALDLERRKRKNWTGSRRLSFSASVANSRQPSFIRPQSVTSMSDLKRPSLSDINKRQSSSDLKRQSLSDLKRQSLSDLKRQSISDLKRQSISDLKRQSLSDLKRTSISDIKGHVSKPSIEIEEADNTNVSEPSSVSTSISSFDSFMFPPEFYGESQSDGLPDNEIPEFPLVPCILLSETLPEEDVTDTPRLIRRASATQSPRTSVSGQQEQPEPVTGAATLGAGPGIVVDNQGPRSRAQSMTGPGVSVPGITLDVEGASGSGSVDGAGGPPSSNFLSPAPQAGGTRRRSSSASAATATGRTEPSRQKSVTMAPELSVKPSSRRASAVQITLNDGTPAPGERRSSWASVRQSVARKSSAAIIDAVQLSQAQMNSVLHGEGMYASRWLKSENISPERQKYSRLIDVATESEGNSQKLTDVKAREARAEAEMKKVLRDLQTWVHATLDTFQESNRTYQRQLLQEHNLLPEPPAEKQDQLHINPVAEKVRHRLSNANLAISTNLGGISHRNSQVPLPPMTAQAPLNHLSSSASPPPMEFEDLLSLSPWRPVMMEKRQTKTGRIDIEKFPPEAMISRLKIHGILESSNEAADLVETRRLGGEFYDVTSASAKAKARFSLSTRIAHPSFPTLDDVKKDADTVPKSQSLRRRLKYGPWFIDPDNWNTVLKSNSVRDEQTAFTTKSSSKKSPVHALLHGMITKQRAATSLGMSKLTSVSMAGNLYCSTPALGGQPSSATPENVIGKQHEHRVHIMA
ncbi:hypothetical protein HDU76_012870 [Blyttiomyces sp. JEL0837]|nr:hypothetical protein HDU76_012870 [Blyttiomyces sp. JEL0837]